MTTTAVTRHLLPGLRPEPLAGYLAGLGLIRLIGEQADPSATAAWTPDGLAISTEVPDIARWLAAEYVPTPVLSPWNSGSGFGTKDKEPLRRLDAIRRHPSPRLAGLRQAIEVAEGVINYARRAGWITEEGVSKQDKDRFVLEFRNRCPDELLPWIDAAIVLASDKLYFPPILGTGGIDGHLDFSTNFHQQLINVIGAADKDLARSVMTARDLLDGTQCEPLAKVPIGQFDPGNAGGPGSSGLGAADSLASPWSLILAVEGSLLFASSTARRNQHAVGQAAIPFTVGSSPEGSASGAAEERPRGELWVPVWREEFTLAEIRQLFAEARASWRGRPAKRAVDFYAATRSLGVARGIDEFVRYGLLPRNGRSFTAVPLDRIVVREETAVQLAAMVQDWANGASSGVSTALTEASRAFDKAHLEFARDGQPMTLARMLAALTSLEMTVGRSRQAKKAVRARDAPLAGAFLSELTRAESAELRVAVGIASCATLPTKDQHARSMRELLLPVEQGKWRDVPVVPGFGARPLISVLADVLIWRSRTAATERDKARFRGIPTFRSGIPVPAADLHALASGLLDHKALDLMLRACLALDWKRVRHQWEPRRLDVPVATLGLLHPLAAGLRPGGARGEPADEPAPALSPEWAALLAAGQVTRVHQEAAARLRQAGWNAVGPPPAQAAMNGSQIAAALVPRCQRPEAVLRLIAFDTNPMSEEQSS